MDLSVVIVLTILGIFVSLVGYKSFHVWNKTSSDQHKLLYTRELSNEWKAMQDKLDQAEQDVKNWKYRFYARGRNYDIELDEDDEDIDPDQDEEGQLSDLVKILYPKLPKSVSKIIDKPELQEAIARSIEKNPDGFSQVIDKFTRKPADQQTNKLKETYL